jgi:AcrR family transcriptional regulator
MSSSSTKALDPRAARSRTAMLDAARRLLVNEGWDSITHARVAEAAGVGRATAYRHWPTATELALEAASLEAEESHPAKTGNLRTDLIAELRNLRTSLTDRGLKPLLLLITERATYNDEFKHVRRELHQRGVGPVRSLLRDAIRCGDLHKKADVDEMISLLAGPIMYEIVMFDRPFPDRRITSITDSVLRDNGYRATNP